MNIVGKEEITKKEFAGDITEGKRTLMVVHALEHSPRKDRLKEILSLKTKDRDLLEEAVEIMKECGSVQFARDTADRLRSEHISRLTSCIDEGPWLSILLEMSDWFVERLG